MSVHGAKKQKKMFSNKDEEVPQGHMAQRADGTLVISRAALLDEFCDLGQMMLVSTKSLTKATLTEDPEEKKALLLEALTAMTELGAWIEVKRKESTAIVNAEEISKEED